MNQRVVFSCVAVATLLLTFWINPNAFVGIFVLVSLCVWTIFFFLAEPMSGFEDHPHMHIGPHKAIVTAGARRFFAWLGLLATIVLLLISWWIPDWFNRLN